MGDAPRYRRVLVKLSGESLCGAGSFGIDGQAVEQVIDELQPVVGLGVQIALVIGGGNILRGRDLSGNPQIQRATADYMGMLATVINALALRDVMESRGVASRVMSAIPMPVVAEPFIRLRAIRHLEKGRVVILAAGTGNPFFTTDTCASLRANELNAEVLLKATKVDGVYDSDPHKNPKARRYDRLTYQQVLEDRLGVMDLTAISMCMERKMPVLVFRLGDKGSLMRAVLGQDVGTLIGE